MKLLFSKTASYATALYTPKTLNPPDRRSCGGFAASTPLPAIRKSLHSTPLKD